MRESRDNSIKLEGISKRFGETVAADNINISLPPSSFVSIVGSSGCGKTTLLRMISGLTSPDSGKIFIGGEDVTFKKAGEREVLTVFQKYALLPNLNVLDNVALGLKISKITNRKLTREEIRERATDMLKTVGLSGYEKRSVNTLSGGQQQRVALARAMVLEPKVLLLDEPLGALDGLLKSELQKILKDLQKRSGITFIYVTHDFSEALSMSDTVFVMNEGRVIESGTPLGVYENPKTAFTAKFIGAKSLFTAFIGKNKLTFAKAEIPFKGDEFAENDEVWAVIDNNGVRVLPPSTAKSSQNGQSEEVLRTEKDLASSVGDNKDKTVLTDCKVHWCEYTGGRYKLSVYVGVSAEEIICYSDKPLESGERINLEIDNSSIGVLKKD